ncbi:hypothetical protein GGI08_004647, partial [Coemansia sp. S2]
SLYLNPVWARPMIFRTETIYHPSFRQQKPEDGNEVICTHVVDGVKLTLALINYGFQFLDKRGYTMI